MTPEQPTPSVRLNDDGPLPAKQTAVLRALSQLSQHVPANRWCLIGGLMVEVLLRLNGVRMLRPTDDGDIVGDVVADRSVLRSLATGLSAIGFEPYEAGWEHDPIARFRSSDHGVFIDVLAPANTGRLRNRLPPVPGRDPLEAPGSDFALATAALVEITYTDHDPLCIRVPSLAGAIYMKASAFKNLSPRTNPHKHLQDSAQLLSVAAEDQLVGHGPAMLKRLRWLDSELSDANSVGWEYVPLTGRNDAIRRLARVVRSATDVANLG